MRLVQYQIPEGTRVGLVKGDDILDLWEMAAPKKKAAIFETMDGLICQDGPSFQMTKELLEETYSSVKKHPQICVHTKSHVVHSIGEVGNFQTTIANAQNTVQTLQHAVTILATGGTEATTSSYGYGTSPAIITQKELEQKLSNHSIDPGAIQSVAV